MGIPSLPTFTYQPVGFMNSYDIDVGRVPALARYFWSKDFLDLIKVAINDPFKTIIGMHAVPVSKIKTGGDTPIQLGTEQAPVSAKLIVNEFVEVNCGSIAVAPSNGVTQIYYDFEPYTKFMLYLPFVGFVSLSANLIMGQTLTVKYHVNVLTGDLVAFVAIGASANIVIGEYSGNCAMELPISEANYGRMFASFASLAGGVITAGVTGSPLPLAGSVTTAVSGGFSPDYQLSGSLSGGQGVMANKNPFLLRIRQQPAIPSKFASVSGFSTYQGNTLGSLTGYTEVYDVHLDGIEATENELNEIEGLLKGGVIL